MTGHAHLVLGTAGHIDHGKTSLVQALTGVDTDRLPEEKARGITIELGFAALDVGGTRISIVDVPGHEKFVRTMAAGAAGLDAVMLLVAADDGMMPQSREHLAICELLGVRRGLLVITKADLVDEEMLELCTAELRDAVAGTFLDGADVIVTSATTGRGIDALRAAIADLTADLPARSATGGAVLPVDRVFSKAGFGAVVTGTLVQGALAVGDDAWLVPGAAGAVSVRGLQVHGEAADQVEAGVRLAVNLRGVSHHDVHRGAVLCTQGAVTASAALHAAVTVLDGEDLPAENAEVSLSLATNDVLARVVPLQTEDAAGGRLVRFVLQEHCAVWPGQRFVMRRPGAHGAATFGGGRVLDPAPPSFKGAFKVWQQTARALAGDDATEQVLALVAEARADGLDEKSLAARLPSGLDLAATLAALVDAGRLARGANDRFVDCAIIEPVALQLAEDVARFHQERPVLRGPAPGDLAAALPATTRDLCGPALDRLVAQGALGVEDGRVFDPARAADPRRDKALGAAGAVLTRAGLTPPLIDEWRGETGLDDVTFADALSELKRTGAAVQLASNLCFSDRALAGLADRVRAHFTAHDVLDTAQFKALGGGLSRKHAIPLFEWLDKTGVTRRDGDVRRKGRDS